MKHIYLDHAAATPLDPEVYEAMKPYFSEQFYNPSATYNAARATRNTLDEARHRVAGVLGARPGEIVFTAGATEANNLAIHGVISKFPGSKILVSAIEHDSVLKAAKQHKHTILSVDPKGRVDLAKLKSELQDDTVVLVSIMYANNEIGTVQDMRAVGKVVEEAKKSRSSRGVSLPLYLHTDAAQAPNCLPIQPKRMHVDLMSLNGGKIYGPKQSGVLFVASGTQLSPIIFGGGQEYGLRSGTENVPGIVGFSLALEKAARLRPAETLRLAELKTLLCKELLAASPDVQLTVAEDALHNLIHITVAGRDNERLMMELDERGIECAVGSACSASNEEPSHVLRAIGMTDAQAQTSLRFTMGRSTTQADVKKVGKMMKEILHG